MILLCGLLVNPQATVASMGILIQTTSLIYIFPSSLSFGVSTRVSNELGANRPERAGRAAAVGLMLGFAFGGVASAYLVRDTWATMFTADPAIVALTASVLPVLGACELGNCPQTAGCGVLWGSCAAQGRRQHQSPFFLPRGHARGARARVLVPLRLPGPVAGSPRGAGH
jgi:multidrug resistance protein, MATE family